MGLSTVYDSVILIDALNDISNLNARIGQDDHRVISVVTRTEVLTGIRSDADRAAATMMLGSCINIPVSEEIADLAADLRKEYRLKTADAIIYATARVLGVSLVTRDKAFPDEADVVRV
jgi:predicted nucleic acid-binding protein